MTQKNENMVLWSVTLVALVAFAGCGRSAGTALGPSGSGSARDSSLTSVDVKLPNRTDLKSQVADIETKMNAYHLVIQAAGCASGLSFNKIGDYKDAEQLASSLTQGCDYTITMSLGNKDATSTTGLKSSYYSNSPGLQIKKSDFDGKAAFALNLALNLTTDGQAIGLKPGAQVTPNPTPAPIATATPTPAPDAQVPANLAAVQGLKTLDGQATSFAQHFKGKYLVLDFSSSGCPPCVSHGKEFNTSASLQKMFDGNVCSHATMVSASDASKWNAIFSGSLTGQHSVAAADWNGLASNTLKSPISGTPFFVVVDRSGAAVHSFAGANMGQLAKYCSAN